MKVKNGRLSLDRSFYETTVNSGNSDLIQKEVLKAKTFISFAEYKNKHSNFLIARLADEDSVIVPSFLQSLLNPDNLIEIGDYILQLNFIDRKVYGILKEDSILVDSLIVRKYNSPNINAIPFDLSVLESMDVFKTNKVKAENANAREEFCFSWCCNRSAGGFRTSLGIAEAYYGTYGIYFKFGGIAHSSQGNARVIFDEKHRVRCGAETSSYRDYNGTFIAERVAYEGTTALERFTFAITAFDNQTSQSQYFARNDGY